MKKNNYTTRNLCFVMAVLAGIYGILNMTANKRTESEKFDDENPYLRATRTSENKQKKVENICHEKRMHSTAFTYEVAIKPALDRSLAFIGLILLLPLFFLISLAIYVDDPGPVIFTQTRVGKNKHFFALHKFRSMKMSTPHDIPTHMLENPDQYITRVGKVLRKTSLDELPQIWDIFRGKMSIIGPRPALWNQEDLVAERDKYNANTVLPGLTGLAQIKGRDELEIPDKARIDGEYVKLLRKKNLTAFVQDFNCFIETVVSVIRHEGVIEGGTGSRQDSVAEEAGFEDYGYKKSFCINKTTHKRVLITGANSYIGEAFVSYAKRYYPNLTIDTIDMIDGSWREFDFTPYDAVFHVAGIAHSDVGSVSKEKQEKYYAVNSDLAVEACQKSRECSVEQFIFMSSMIVYGDSAPYGKEKIIDEKTAPSPANFYGDSKWRGDVGVRKLQSSEFKVAVLRVPMVYGYGSKGNYPILAKLAKRLPVFPNVLNKRSMLHIDNLCEFVSLLVLSGEGGIYFPQNEEYAGTAELVKLVSQISEKKLVLTRLLNPAVRIVSYLPGKLSGLVNKAFGNNVYSQRLSEYNGLDYRVVNLEESIRRTEEKYDRFGTGDSKEELENYSVLMSVYSKDLPEYLEQSIESMLKQTVLCTQFVLVEDGPISGELEEKVSDYEKQYPSLFTVVRLEQNVGLGKALDEGLKYCTYDLVARMDADDISLPERCEKLLKLFQKNENLSIAGTNIDEFYDKPSNIISSRIVPSGYYEICKFMKRRSPFNHPTVMFRKSEVIRCGGYGKMRRKQDLDLFARMLNNDCYALNINESLLLFRANQDNYKRRKSWEYCKSYIEVERMNYKRGYCSLTDLVWVVGAQIVMYISPEIVMKKLSDIFLRKT